MNSNVTDLLQTIQPAGISDLESIFWLFENAIAYQKEKGFIGWNTYDKSFLRAEVENQRIFQIERQHSIVCIFSICTEDPLIWGKLEKGDAVYLHRVVVHPECRGERLFEQVLSWALNYGRLNNRIYIRMDTWSDNSKLINYYKNYGFRFVGNHTTPNDPMLPDQHRNLSVALLERLI